MKRNKFYIAFMIFSLYNTFVSGTCGGTGRRCRLKICCPQGRAGSIPARCTIYQFLAFLVVHQMA